MKARAALYYMYHKYIHELRHDNYMMDMLRISAAGNLKEVPERYYDMTEGKRQALTKKKIEYNVNDVVDMFAGRGRLV